MTFNAAPIYSLKWKGDERRIFEQDQEKIISVLLLNFDFFSFAFPFHFIYYVICYTKGKTSFCTLSGIMQRDLRYQNTLIMTG